MQVKFSPFAGDFITLSWIDLIRMFLGQEISTHAVHITANLKGENE